MRKVRVGAYKSTTLGELTAITKPMNFLVK